MPRLSRNLILAIIAIILIAAGLISLYFRPMIQTSGQTAVRGEYYAADKESDSSATSFLGRIGAFGIAPSPQQAPAPSMVSSDPGMPGYNAGSADEGMPAERLIIKTASLSLIVDDVLSAIDTVAGYAARSGGFEVTRNVYKSGLTLAGSVTVRVPSSGFDAGLEEVRKLGELQNQQVGGQDVTEEFVDIEAQLKNLRATEAQFLQIMQKAEKIEDVLAVQRELTNVRSQIERLEGRKKYLEQSARLSTITVYVSTDPETLPIVDEGDQWKPLAVAKDAVRDLLAVGKSLVNGAIRVAVYLPLWGIGLGIVWAVYRRLKKRAA